VAAGHVRVEEREAMARPHVRVTTVGDLLDERGETRPDDEAVVFPGRRCTYGDLSERARAVGRMLLRLGVGPADRVGILLPASVDLLAVLFGAVTIGAVAVPVNARYRDSELRHVVVHSGMRVLVTAPPAPGEPDLPALLTAALGLAAGAPPDDPWHSTLGLDIAPELERVVVLAPGPLPAAPATVGPGRVVVTDPVAAADAVPEDLLEQRRRAVRVRDTATLVYTSGTTAAPKGAMLSHEALVRLAAGITERMHLDADDRIWTAIPLFHGGGITFALSALTAGAPFVHPGWFDAAATPAYLEQERVTVALAAFETIWLPVLDRPDMADRDLSRLRLVMVVGVPERLRAMAERVPQAVQVSCVAMTESSAFLTLNHLEDPLEARLSTGGHPMPGMSCRVVDPDTDRDLPAGRPGELLFRGPNTFDGYFRDPEGTAAAFDDDGWFHSGDIVVTDPEGRLRFEGRLKDMLKVGGENVSAAEVENHLLGHPAVGIVAVVAAPDARYVEVPAAYVQLAPGARATEEELVEFCVGRIATYRVPRYVRFVSEWPMSGTKIKKVELRRMIADELAAAGITEAPRVAAGS
jgi:fatty-acyl-CoA synthase